MLDLWWRPEERKLLRLFIIFFLNFEREWLLFRFFEKFSIICSWYFDQKITFWIYQSTTGMNIQKHGNENGRKKIHFQKSVSSLKFSNIEFVYFVFLSSEYVDFA